MLVLLGGVYRAWGFIGLWEFTKVHCILCTPLPSCFAICSFFEAGSFQHITLLVKVPGTARENELLTLNSSSQRQGCKAWSMYTDPLCLPTHRRITLHRFNSPYLQPQSGFAVLLIQHSLIKAPCSYIYIYTYTRALKYRYKGPP